MKIKAQMFERDQHPRFYALIGSSFCFWSAGVNAWVPTSERLVIAELYRKRKAEGKVKVVTLKGRIVL